METVRKNGTAFEVVCDNGDVVPAVEQRDGGWIPCPYRCTSETHTHGVDGAPLTHRVAHCGEDRREESKPGYFLLRQKPVGLLDVPHKWWKDRVRVLPEIDNLGFGAAGMGDVAGLLGRVA